MLPYSWLKCPWTWFTPFYGKSSGNDCGACGFQSYSPPLLSKLMLIIYYSSWCPTSLPVIFVIIYLNLRFAQNHTGASLNQTVCPLILGVGGLLWISLIYMALLMKGYMMFVVMCASIFKCAIFVCMAGCEGSVSQTEQWDGSRDEQHGRVSTVSNQEAPVALEGEAYLL